MANTDNDNKKKKKEEWYVCLYASVRQHSIALTEMRHESPAAFARLRNKTTRDNRTEIKVTANPLGLLKSMEQADSKGEVVKELTCVIGPVKSQRTALEIKQGWECNSRGAHPRCVTACILGKEYGVPTYINWHAFYQMDPNEVTIIEDVDPSNMCVTKLTHLFHAESHM